MHEEVIISHRGARYEIGRGDGCYGIWPAGAVQSPALEWWPQTAQGWQDAWSRFTDLERAAAIAPAGQQAVPAVRGRSRGRLIAAVLLAIGVACGIAGLFPGYFGGANLAGQPDELVPHAIYLTAWTASAALVLLGGTRCRTGALLATGTSIVTFGLFLADLGTAVTGGAHLLGAGLVLGLIGWLACAAGSASALWAATAGAPRRPRGLETALILTLATVAGLGTAIAFAPSWDSFTLRTASGVTQSLTAGNAFANPALVIAGDVAVMAALVAVAVAAAAWRPIRNGAVLLAGAIIAMAAQAISALIQSARAASPLQFGITPGQAARAGLTISSGLTPAFWIYCAFVVALTLVCAQMLAAPAPAPPAPAGPAALDATSAAAHTVS